MDELIGKRVKAKISSEWFLEGDCGVITKTDDCMDGDVWVKFDYPPYNPSRARIDSDDGEWFCLKGDYELIDNNNLISGEI